jgi:hypothetical protein
MLIRRGKQALGGWWPMRTLSPIFEFCPVWRCLDPESANTTRALRGTFPARVANDPNGFVYFSGRLTKSESLRLNPRKHI